MPSKKYLHVTKLLGVSVPAAPWEGGQSAQPAAKPAPHHEEQPQMRVACHEVVGEVVIQSLSSKAMQAASDISRCGLGAFATALSKGISGDQIIYHIGKKCDSKHKKEASIAAQQGLVFLTSKRLMDGNFEYIATIAKKFRKASSSERNFLLGKYLYERASSLGELQGGSLSTFPGFNYYLHECKLCITHQVFEDVCSWIEQEIENCKVIKFADLMSSFGLKSQEASSGKVMNEFEAKLNSLGIGVAPHSSLVRRKKHNNVIAFRVNPQVMRLEDQSHELVKALVAIALATSIFHEADCLTDHSKQRINELILANFHLNEHDRCHILANLVWFSLSPPTNSILLPALSNTSAESAQTLRKIAVACAGEISMVDRKLVAHLEQIYNVLWLPSADAYSDLHAGEVADGPCTVRASQPGCPGEAIPELEKASGPKLDASRIAAIRSDTERVSSVLGQIFDVEEEENGASGPASQSQLAGLDPKHGALVFELVTREHWSDTEFETICASHGLMASGALEVVNEWAFETYNEALLDEYDGYDVSPEIAEAVKEEMGAEGRNV